MSVVALAEVSLPMPPMSDELHDGSNTELQSWDLDSSSSEDSIVEAYAMVPLDGEQPAMEDPPATPAAGLVLTLHGGHIAPCPMGVPSRAVVVEGILHCKRARSPRLQSILDVAAEAEAPGPT